MRLAPKLELAVKLAIELGHIDELDDGDVCLENGMFGIIKDVLELVAQLRGVLVMRLGVGGWVSLLWGPGRRRT
jgi:hypothetical protein